MSYALTPCPLPGCGKRHRVVRYVDPKRPGTRTDDRNLAGAGVDRQSRSSDRQPVGASAPERQFPPSGLPTTG